FCLNLSPGRRLFTQPTPATLCELEIGVEAVLVTFQAQVIRRGVAIRRLREAETSIKDSDNYALLKTLSREHAQSSFWECCFLAAVEHAAEALDKTRANKYLDEAEDILLALAQIRNEVTTGIRVDFADLRRSYLAAIESRMRGELDEPRKTEAAPSV